eukprot:1160406-Pelagomonas_calceolata.AAC.5
MQLGRRGFNGGTQQPAQNIKRPVSRLSGSQVLQWSAMRSCPVGTAFVPCGYGHALWDHALWVLPSRPVSRVMPCGYGHALRVLPSCPVGTAFMPCGYGHALWVLPSCPVGMVMRHAGDTQCCWQGCAQRASSLN